MVGRRRFRPGRPQGRRCRGRGRAGEHAGGLGTLGSRSADHPSGLRSEADFLVAFGGNNTSGPINVATAARAKGGTGHGDFESETFVVGALQANDDGYTGQDAERGHLVVQSVLAFDETQITHPENRSQPDDRSPQLAASARPPTIAFDCKAGGDTSFAIGEEIADALRGEGHGGGHAAVAFQTRIARNGRGQPDDVVPALNGSDAGATSDMRPCVAVFKPSHFTRDKDGAPSDSSPPLSADADKGDQDPVLLAGAAVRRLTPVECARLQAFPDDYLDIKFRGKPAADGPKYRALGNSMCVNDVRWILQRIEQFEREVRR